MRRSCVLAVIACAGLGACNALTGVSSLEVSDELLVDDGGPPATDDATTSTEDVFVPPVDSGDPDVITPPVDASDAGGDAVADAPVDTFVPCTPGSSGPRYGSSAAAQGWSEDNGILVPNDNVYTHTNGFDTPMTVMGFGFNIPQGARIDGIKVDFRRSAEGPVADEAVTLPKGNPKSNGAWPQGPFNGPYILTTYGGATDTWGATWSASDINAPTFSVVIDIMGNGDGHADSLGVTVYYCN